MTWAQWTGRAYPGKVWPAWLRCRLEHNWVVNLGQDGPGQMWLNAAVQLQL